MTTHHLLDQLVLPDRFEALEQHLGSELARVLVRPSDSMERAFIAVAQEVSSKRRGVVVPAWAQSGTGKSTLASGLSHFWGSFFAPSVMHRGPIADGALESTARDAAEKLADNDRRVIPIVVDGREGEPPIPAELAALKRFVRTEHGSRSVILWLETNRSRADGIGKDYVEIAGDLSIDLPVDIAGPPREAWSDIAKWTLELSNDVANLESLGVDPSTYEVEDFRTIGQFLGEISKDFDDQSRKLREETAKPTQLVIGFASESRGVGPLAQLTEGRRLGLLNAHALVTATPGTELGRWWGQRLGLLTSTIVRLNARAYVFPPTLTVTVLRRAAANEVKELLASSGVSQVDPSAYWDRSDVGRFLLGEERDAPESRGNPSDSKARAFQALVDAGHIRGGKDKTLHHALAQSLRGHLVARGVEDASVLPEERLETPAGGGEVIPDLRVEQGNLRTCIEITWRQGDWVLPKNKATMAEYILRKLKSYASALGWDS